MTPTIPQSPEVQKHQDEQDARNRAFKPIIRQLILEGRLDIEWMNKL